MQNSTPKTTPAAPWLSLCLVCGYDLSGQTERCPECGKPLAEITLVPDSRAARWLTQRSRWLVAPIVVFLLGVVAWHALLRPTTGYGFEHLGWYALSFAIIGAIAVGIHAIAYACLRARNPARTLRARIWFLTLPALHAWWIAWPLIAIVALRLAVAMGADDRSAFFFIYFGSPISALVTPLLWRVGWWGVSRWLGLKARPRFGHWLAAGLIGVPVAMFQVFMILALATADV